MFEGYWLPLCNLNDNGTVFNESNNEESDNEAYNNNVDQGIERDASTPPFVLSTHKFHECYTFKPSAQYVYDVCDAIAAECSVESTIDAFETDRGDDEWFCIDFLNERTTNDPVDPALLPPDSDLNAIGWFVVDYQNRRIHTNDPIFYPVLEHVYLEFYALKYIIFVVLKNIPRFVVHIVDYHADIKPEVSLSNNGIGYCNSKTTTTTTATPTPTPTPTATASTKIATIETRGISDMFLVWIWKGSCDEA
nr:hypothetical protein HvNV061 [Heliothis virescens nudivirus]